MKKYNNANEAFEILFKEISENGMLKEGTKALHNVCFEIQNPLDNNISNEKRKWNKDYAELEWQWYLSKDRSVEKIKERAKIWDTMHTGDNIVNSNYGWQWARNEQLDKVVRMLVQNPFTRRAVLSIYDGKEIDTYSKDTPCTYAVQFTILDNKLNMAVLMRSNDLWYGFCNDQYCFSMLQQMVADFLCIEVGTYYHFAHNLHLYNDKL